MSNGDSTANVGDLVEMESQVHLILKFGIGDMRVCGGRGRHSRKSELIK